MLEGAATDRYQELDTPQPVDTRPDGLLVHEHSVLRLRGWVGRSLGRGRFVDGYAVFAREASCVKTSI